MLIGGLFQRGQITWFCREEWQHGLAIHQNPLRTLSKVYTQLSFLLNRINALTLFSELKYLYHVVFSSYMLLCSRESENL